MLRPDNDPETDWEARKVVLVRNLTTTREVYWVNVTQNSGPGSPGCLG